MKQSKEIAITQSEATFLITLLAHTPRTVKLNLSYERGITESAWNATASTIREKLSGGWREEKPAPPTMLFQLKRIIENLTAEGCNPLVQKDVISSNSLMLEILKGKTCLPSTVQVAQALTQMDYHSVGRILLVGQRHYLWALASIDRGHAVSRVHARLLTR